MSASQAEHAGSIPVTCSKKKDTTLVVSFFLGSAPFGRSTLRRLKSSGEVNSPLRKFSAHWACEFTAHSRRGPEGPFLQLHLYCLTITKRTTGRKSCRSFSIHFHTISAEVFFMSACRAVFSDSKNTAVKRTASHQTTMPVQQ